MSIAIVPRRFSTRATSVAVVAALTFAAVPAPASADTFNPTFRAITGIGADASQANMTWRSNFRGAEYVRIAKEIEPDQVTVVKANDRDKGAIGYRSLTAVVTGLEPSTSYLYQVGSDEGGWSGVHRFVTDAAEGDWRFLAFADAQIGVANEIAQQGIQWRDAANASTIHYSDASFLMLMGDQVNGWLNTEDQYDEFFSPEQIRAYRTGVVKGNHETYPSSAGESHFAEHFNLPNDDGDHNYYFEFNNVLVIGLNSNLKDQKGLDTQAAFVRKAVEEHGEGKDWIIAATHFAPYSHGGRYDNSEIVAMRNTLGPVFSEVGVDLVLSGHDHMHNRSHLVNGTEATIPDELAAPGDVLNPAEGDVLYMTLSTAGGGKFYDFTDRNGKKHRDMTIEEARERDLGQPTIAWWNQDRTPDYSVIEVAPHALTVRTHNVYDNSIVDEVTLNHRTNTPTETPQPSEEPTPTVTTTETVVATTTATTTLEPTTVTETTTTTLEPTTVTQTETAQPSTVTETAKVTETQQVTETAQATITASSTVTQQAAPVTVTETETTQVTETVTETKGEVPVTVTQTVTEGAAPAQTVTQTQTETATATVTSTVRSNTNEPAPAQGSAGSSVGSIVALVLAALFALLGVLAFNIDTIVQLAAQFGIRF
ncbi:FN3 domain-containing metallophosphoesterase family protein [Corynebacterium sp. Q4381]|uniref:FN3 domain-containing metallophosphoesterase family protein n=1 Tax=Corynebacterium sp. Marseille-Q4381 TaxID=3121597 RepID=UPI002FE67BC7